MQSTTRNRILDNILESKKISGIPSAGFKQGTSPNTFWVDLLNISEGVELHKWLSETSYDYTIDEVQGIDWLIRINFTDSDAAVLFKLAFIS